uniref:Uncharacterized protein n=1 Tax=Noccaea caerulescens TaxID=107243 RepID=A0A1J3EWS0_NOCCA
MQTCHNLFKFQHFVYYVYSNQNMSILVFVQGRGFDDNFEEENEFYYLSQAQAHMSVFWLVAVDRRWVIRKCGADDEVENEFSFV